MPPISHSGYLGYDYGLAQGGADDVATHGMAVNWSVASYIKQPYIARYSASITLRKGLGSGGSGGDSEQDAILGNLNLRLFPQSHFPFEFYFVEEDQQSAQGENELATSRRTYGLIQSYKVQQGYSARLQLEHVDQEFDDRVEQESQFGRNSWANLVLTLPLNKWNFSWSSLYRQDRNEATQIDRDRLFSSLRYDWRPSSSLSMDGFLIFSDSRINRANRGVERRRRGDFSNYLRWRPASERPLIVTSVLRHSEDLGGGDGDVLAGGQTSALATASYLLSDQISLVASGSASLQRSDDEDVLSAGSAVDARYQSTARRLGWFDYQWNGGLGGRWNRQEDEWGSVFSAEGRVGHSLSRQFSAGSMRMSGRLFQTVSAIKGSDGESTQILSQSLSVNLNLGGVQRSSFASVTISDGELRGQGGRSDVTGSRSQFITLMLSQQQNLTRESRLSGSLSVQASRNQRSGKGWRESGPSGSADISYSNRMFLRIPLLELRSSLRWSSSAFLTSADDLSEAPGTDRLFWDNRLRYRIGLLEASLLVRFSRVNGEGRNLYYLSLRRYFGGTIH